MINILIYVYNANELFLCPKPFIGRSNQSVIVHHHHRSLNIAHTHGTTEKRDRRYKMSIVVSISSRKINDAYLASSRIKETIHIYIFFCDY